ncbi:hypothetical protein Tco_0523255 [Tanacetum coccineum]
MKFRKVLKPYNNETAHSIRNYDDYLRAASKIKSDRDGEIREVYEKAFRMENPVRLVDDMSVQPSSSPCHSVPDNYHGDQYYYGEPYYHGKTVEYYHMVECKEITVVILVRDRCPRGKDNLPRLLMCLFCESKTKKSSKPSTRPSRFVGLPTWHGFKWRRGEALEDCQSIIHLRENISQEDLNLKFLRSMPAEWNTHVVVWRNKPDLKTMSIDDLYNKFKIVEQEVKRFVSSSSKSGSQNMAFVSTHSCTNEDTAHVQVSTARTPISAASTNDNAASLSYATVYAFLANQPCVSQLVHEDLEQIHDDDLEEMDLKWECRNPRSQEGRARSYDQGSRNQESTRRTVKEVPTNMALMAFLDLEVLNDKTCSNTCLKLFETLKTQYDNLRIEFNKTEFDLAKYKRGLAFIEEQLVFYKKNEAMFTDQIAVLKRDASFNESEIIALKIQIERLKKDKEDNLIKIDNYENASKSLEKLIGSQLADNNRKGVGYIAIPPPPTGLFAPPSIDLSNSGLEEFKQPEFEGFGPKANKSVCVDATKEVEKTSDALIIEDWVFDCDEDESVVKVLKSDNVQPKLEQANQPRNVRQNPRMVQKPMLNNVQKGTSQRDVKPVWNHAMRTNHQNLSNTRRNLTPTTVLTKSGKVPISTARQSSSRVAVPVSAARPINTAASKSFKWEVLLGNKRLMLLSPQHAGFGDLKQMSLIISLKPVDHTIGDPQVALKDTGIFNSGCSRHMTRNKSYLTDYQDYDGGFVAFAGSSKGGRTPIVSFMRPFGCPVTILNTLDYLGKFDGKADEGVLVGYSINNKDFRVYNHRTRIVEENLHVNFLENKPTIAGNGLEWLFDIDSLTNTMNYQPVSARNRTNSNAGIQTNSDAVVSSANDDIASKKIDQEPAKEEDQTLKDASN